MPDVGIIIPSHNAARFLPQTVQSICQQTFAHWTCVIVDDCSLDNSREIIDSCCNRDSRVSLLALAENRGTSAARNAGLAALGKSVQYVIFLDSDDVWNPSSLQVLVDAIEGHPSWAAVYGNCRAINQAGTHIGSKDVDTVSRERFDYQDGRLVRLIGTAETTFCQFLLRNPVVSPGCLLIRAAAIANITEGTSPLFDEKTKYGEDLGAWMRIRRAGCIGYLDQIVLDYRLHGSNKSNRRWRMAVSVRKVRLKALLDPKLKRHELHEACAASRAYRTYRIRGELRAAAKCLRHRRLRAAGRLLVLTVADALDVLIIFAVQMGQRARVFARDGGNAAWRDGPRPSRPIGDHADAPAVEFGKR
jgi:teichuronic acid biosynthesis glycosyltransferase TuaG